MSYTIQLPFVGASVRATQLPGVLKYYNLGTGQADPTDHTGTSASAYDFALAVGTQLRGLGNGEVVAYVNVVPDGMDASTSYKTSDPYGNFVTVRYTMGDGNFLYATYAHLKQNSGLAVHTAVSATTIVGEVGLTGNTNGAHLHIQFGLSTAPATSSGAGALKADGGGDYDIVTFGDPTSFIYDSHYNEYQYTFSSAATLVAQSHAQTISLTNNSFNTTGIVGDGYNTSSWDPDDYFSFTAPNDGTLSLHLSGLSDDLDLRLMDSVGQRLAQSINGGTTAEDISNFTVHAGTTYLVQVDPYHYDHSSYSLSLTFEPTLTGANSAFSNTDFNGDQKGDFLWRNSTGALAIWEMSGAQRIESAGVSQEGYWKVEAVTDINGDHKSDLIWRGSGGEYYAWEMNGTQVGSGVSLLTGAGNWHISKTGDFNGDGKGDFLWRNSSSGDLAIWEMNGSQVVASAGIGQEGYWKVEAVADIDGDGKSDLIWRGNGGEYYAWLMNGTQISSGGLITSQAGNWHIAFTGDFNGDGKGDFLWRNSGTGDIAIWEMNGTQLLAGAGESTEGIWKVETVADIDGDHKSDIIWRSSAGDYYAWEMNGTALKDGAFIASGANDWHLFV